MAMSLQVQREPRELPMLFSAPMVRALLSGAKTVTRRIIPEPKAAKLHGRHSLPDRHFFDRGFGDGVYLHWFYGGGDLGDDAQAVRVFSRWNVGDRIVVKEAAWMWCEKRPNGKTAKGRQKFHFVPMREAPVLYCADHPAKPVTPVVSPVTGNEWGWRKKLGRFLPKWASRITLEVVDVRAERLQAITEEDARAEGVEPLKHIGADQRIIGDESRTQGTHPYTLAYAVLWDTINGDRKGGRWIDNPWVWRVEFRRVKP